MFVNFNRTAYKTNDAAKIKFSSEGGAVVLLLLLIFYLYSTYFIVGAVALSGHVKLTLFFSVHIHKQSHEDLVVSFTGLLKLLKDMKLLFHFWFLKVHLTQKYSSWLRSLHCLYTMYRF